MTKVCLIQLIGLHLLSLRRLSRSVSSGQVRNKLSDSRIYLTTEDIKSCWKWSHSLSTWSKSWSLSLFSVESFVATSRIDCWHWMKRAFSKSFTIIFATLPALFLLPILLFESRSSFLNPCCVYAWNGSFQKVSPWWQPAVSLPPQSLWAQPR